ncbi:hypothetical protein NQ315_005966 [Exocentrus adspersus]|uniref:Major facilitator superfamily (MFS) profile domain-containing protein n=1 Tax=Exocentrus adspersus TaxID=1586481 RepID=A0AAV8VBB1_9CUCU|nr:hypothetical protein NQ315_005966 [Exocentrus adspersus]
MVADNVQGKKLPQYIAALAVCLGSVAAGTVLGWTSNITDKLQNSELNDVAIDSDAQGWIGSFATIGGMVMCFPIGYICDLIGRKWGCLMTVIPFSVGWLLIILADNVAMIYVGRFLTGLAGGAFCVAAPIYTSEIAEKEIRGTLGSFFQLLLTVGILLSYIIGAYMSPRDVSIVCAVIPIIFAVVFFFQPETPVYYMKNNKPDEALSSLRRLRGSSYNSENEIKEIKEALDQDASIKVSFFQAATTTASKKALFICFGLMFFQQMSGINAVIFYTGDIFTAAGSSLAPSTATILVGVMQVVATFVSSVTVDRFGRKVLLFGSIVFMMLSGLLLGVFFTLKDRDVLDADGIDKISFLPILSLIVFISAFSLGFGPIPWLISAELMPEEIKSTACSAAATFNWLLAFIVTRFYGNLKEAIGGDATFYIFAGISMVGIAFVFIIIPETKGKSFTEVQAILSGKPVQVRDDREGIDNPSFKN